MKAVICMCLVVFAVGLFGCTTAKEGGQTTASAGHSPLLQMQAGLHFYTSNTRPVQGMPDGGAEGSDLEKIADKLTFGNVTVETTTTISSGDGGVETAADKQTEQAPVTDTKPNTEVKGSSLP